MRLRLFQVVFPLMIALGSHGQSADMLRSQGHDAYNRGDYQRAAELSKQLYQLLVMARPGHEDFEVATAALNTARALQKAGAPRDAIPFYNTACRIASVVRGPASRELATCLMFRVEAEVAADQIPEAETTAANAVSVVAKAMPRDGLAAAHFHIGEVFRARKALVQAARYFDEAARIYGPQDLNNPEHLASALAEAASALYLLKDFAGAVPRLEKAVAVERARESAAIANAITKVYMLADCYREIGEYDRSISALKDVASALKNVSVAGHISTNEILLEIAERQNQSAALPPPTSS